MSTIICHNIVIIVYDGKDNNDNDSNDNNKNNNTVPLFQLALSSLLYFV